MTFVQSTFWVKIRLPYCSLHMEMTTATIHNAMHCFANWLNRSYQKVTSPTISLKWTIKRFHRYFFHRPRVTSTDGSAEGIATSPPESDLDDEQIRGHAWLHHCTYRREEQVADRSRVYHSFRENSESSSSRFRASAGRPAAAFSPQNKVEWRISFRQRRCSLGISINLRRK